MIARMNIGGPAVLVTQLLNELDRAQFETILITGYCENNEAEYAPLQHSTFPVHRVPSLGRGIRFLGDAKAMIDTRRALKAFRPDIVHTHTAKAGVIGRLSAFSLRRRPTIVHTFHGHVLSGYFSPRVTSAIAKLEAILAKITDRIVVVGDSIGTDLLKAGIGKPDQYVTIAPQVTMDDLPDRASARTELGLDQNKPVVAFVGRLTGIKRPELFLEVAEQLHALDLDIQFLVVGDGEQRQQLEAFAKENNLPVTFTGWLDDPRTAYAAMDLLLLTSANEGRPLTVLEALFTCTPVLATDVGSLRELDDPSLTLTRVDTDPRDFSQLAAKALSEANRSNVLQTTTLSHSSTSEHTKLYRQLKN